jgi:hypothetical protein
MAHNHADRPGIGSQADQLARLDHAMARHGFNAIDCPKCGGRAGGCAVCDDDDGQIFLLGDLTPCGPSCPLKDVRPV